VSARGETYVDARARLLRDLAALGWETRPFLKFPWAARDAVRLNFRAQAVYLGEHSLFADIRGMSATDLVARAVRALAIRHDEGVT
jgi:hypothetical protein